MKIIRNSYDKLRTIATCPQCRDLLAHPALLCIGASPAKLLMLVANISQEAWKSVGDQVVFFRSSVASRLIDSLLLVTTVLLQACCDKLLVNLHLLGAWILHKSHLQSINCSCTTIMTMGCGYRSSPHIEAAIKDIYQYCLNVRRPLACSLMEDY